MIKARMTKPAVPTVESLRQARETEHSAQQGAMQLNRFTFRPEKGIQFYGRRRGSADRRLPLDPALTERLLDEARLTVMAAGAVLANPEYAAAVWTDRGKWAVNAAGTVTPADHRKLVPELLPADTEHVSALQHATRLAITTGTEAAPPFVFPLDTQLDMARAAQGEKLTYRRLGSVAASEIEPARQFEPQVPVSEELIAEPLPLVPFNSMSGQLESDLPSSLSTVPFPLEFDSTTVPLYSGDSFRGALTQEQP